MAETSAMFDPTVTRKENYVRSAVSKGYQEKGTSHNRAEFALHLNDGYDVEYLWIPQETHTTEAITVTLHPHRTLAIAIYGTAAQLQDLARAISAAVAAGWAEANSRHLIVDSETQSDDARGPLILQAIDGVPHA